jgi:hypothetical protein
MTYSLHYFRVNKMLTLSHFSSLCNILINSALENSLATSLVLVILSSIVIMPKHSIILKFCYLKSPQISPCRSSIILKNAFITLNQNKFPKYYTLLFTQEYNNVLIKSFSDKIVKIKEQHFMQVESNGLFQEFYFSLRLSWVTWRDLENYSDKSEKVHVSATQLSWVQAAGGNYDFSM